MLYISLTRSGKFNIVRGSQPLVTFEVRVRSVCIWSVNVTELKNQSTVRMKIYAHFHRIPKFYFMPPIFKSNLDYRTLKSASRPFIGA